MVCFIHKLQKHFMKDMGSGKSEIQRKQKKYIWKNRVAKNSYTVFCSKGKG